MAHRAIFRPSGESDTFHMLGVDGAVLARGSETDGSFELVVGSFPIGFALPPHRHAWAEFYVVTGGAIDVTIGRRTQTIEPGGFVHVPPNAVHTIATPDSACEALVWSSGARAIRMFEDLANSLPAGLPTPDLLPPGRRDQHAATACRCSHRSMSNLAA